MYWGITQARCGRHVAFRGQLVGTGGLPSIPSFIWVLVGTLVARQVPDVLSHLASLTVNFQGHFY